jgi:heme-degrading monooxygenase HmoA
VSRIASFHLVRERPRRQPLVLARLATDRLRLRHVDGLVFWRLLGTGRGNRSASGADLRRSALFAVWRDEAALDAFLASDPIVRRWQRGDEAWHVRLRGLGGHGSWNGFAVVDGLAAGRSDRAVVIVTRADVRWRSWRRFARASRVVNEAVRSAPGLLAVVGIGEAPVGRLGTFSVWESLEAARAFAERDATHRETVASARSGAWFGEELFARFEPSASTGTWNGGDPLARIQES